MSSTGFSGMEFETILREGMNAARTGRKAVARRLLMRAAVEKPNDSRVWLWLSATTDDPREQRELLEKAVAADPYNTAAQKGLAQLAGKRDGPPPDAAPQPGPGAGEAPPPPQTIQATTQTYDCPKCGGRMHYQLDARNLVCEYCGHVHETQEELAPDRAEVPLSGVLRTPKAGSWAASVQEVECEKCGAHSVQPPGARTTQCAYCGSKQLVQSEQLKELVDPQVIALFRVQEDEARQKLRGWLNRGLFAPDDLNRQARTLNLRPAYYPFWTFDGGVEIRWSVEVREHYGRSLHNSPEWTTVSGVANEFFDDVLVSGVSALKPGEVSAIEPFNLKDVIRFDPDHIAGWPAMAYDRPLSQASIAARAGVMQRLRPKMRSRIEPGKEKRNIQIGAGNWSGVTYKHVLLPIWVGTYHYEEDEFHVLINGQTGKVGGTKPKDGFKVAGVWIIAVLGVALLVAALAWLAMSLDWF